MRDVDIQVRRQGKHLAKKREEKELLAILRKHDRLWNADIKDFKNPENWIPLDKPERAGWKRLFELRADVARGKDAAIYHTILPHIQNLYVCSRKDFKRRDWETKAWVPIEQSIRSISHKQFNRLIAERKFTAKHVNCFDKAWKDITDVKGKVIGGEWIYRFAKDWMFVLKVEPFTVTHKYIPNQTRESEMKKLDNMIETNHLWPKIYRAKSKPHSRYRDDYRIKEIFKATLRQQEKDIREYFDEYEWFDYSDY